ncbi:dynein axonemal assembly factor 5 isoform X2 [Engystomops pustulosus]|uniref:dynein axonemal assembly factor 5 isoform X2 n=1 Tax=Engystomops pustulosus TaxID=76066 RepID=UPI003AFB5621
MMAADGEQRAAREVSQALARHLNCLNDENKSARRRALAAIQKEAEDRRLSSGVLQEVLGELLKPLLRCLTDPMEKCRELAIHILTHCVRSVPRPEEALPYLVPAITQRLGGPEITEPSEELRLALTQLLTLLVEVCGRRLGPYLDDMVRILQRTLVDPFPDVKKESCKCAANYARSIPEHFHMQSESLIKPLMQTISHQHSKVRVAVIQTTGAVIQYGNGKSVDDVLSHLAQRLFDDAPQVRLAVTVVVGDWLLELRDRYSYFHKLIPLVLSCTTDEIPDIKQTALNYWQKIGLQWEKENEEDLKDKMDFSATCPPLYPPEVQRPGLGCRELIFRNLSKILPAVSHDITDWVANTRIKAAQLLVVLLLHAEDHATQHMELLLSTLYRSCLDEEEKVVLNSIKSAELLGTFVDPEVFLKLILPALQKSPISSHLTVLAAFIRGSSCEALTPHLHRIADGISKSEICQGSEKIQDVMLSLAEVQGVNGLQGLYQQHMPELMHWASKGHEHWTSFSMERAQFEILVSESGPVIGEHLDLLLPVLRTCLHPDKEPQMRLKLFTLLSKLLLKANESVNSRGQFHLYSETLIKDILVPNLKWYAGRTAGAIRTIAVSCLWVLLQSDVLSPEEVLPVQEVLMPQVLATLEEDSKTSRLVSCRIIKTLLGICGQHLDPDKLNKIYPEVVKRLDDASEEVRMAAAKTLGLWFKFIDERYERTTYRGHLEFLYRCLLVHLDDTDTALQATVLDVLKEGSVVYPSVLVQEIEAMKHKHKTPDYCDQLLLHIQNHSSAST